MRGLPFSPCPRERILRHFDALCGPEPQVGPLAPALSPSEGERGNRWQPSGKPRFRGRAAARGKAKLAEAAGASSLPEASGAGVPGTSSLSVRGLLFLPCLGEGAETRGKSTSAESKGVRSFPEQPVAGSGTAAGCNETGVTSPVDHDTICAQAKSMSFSGADALGASSRSWLPSFAAGVAARGALAGTPRARAWGFNTARWIRPANSPAVGGGSRLGSGFSWEGGLRKRIGGPAVEVKVSAPFSAAGW
jgi:hypothetical protein